MKYSAFLALAFTLLFFPSAFAGGSRVTHDDILRAIQRHQAGDWGDVDKDDHQANDRALVEGTRILSVYFAAGGTKFWLITEADRSVTTVLLPEDY